MRPVTLTLISFIAAANSIALSQARASAGNFTLNGALVSGGVATIPAPSQVLIHSAGNSSAISFVVTGTDVNGAALSETVAGTNASDSITVHKFKTVTQIASTGNANGNVTAGTTTTNTSAPCPVDQYINPVNIGLFFKVSTNTNAFKVQYSGENAWDYADADTFNANGTWFDHASMTAMTAAASGTILFPIRAVRLQSAQTGAAVTGTLTVDQSGIV